MLALCYIESTATEKQSQALELAAVNQRVYGRSPTALATLGWVYFRLNRIKDAERIFQQIVALNQIEPAAAYFVASLLEKKGDFVGANRLLAQAVSSTDYFMFRRTAQELLDSVKAKLPTTNSVEDDESSKKEDP